MLGFTCGMQTPGYSNLYRDSVRVMLAAPNEHGRDDSGYTLTFGAPSSKT